MCEWISKTFPWCVEHIGSMSLGGQIAVALFAVLFLTAAYIAAYNAVCAAREYSNGMRHGREPARRRERVRRPNNLALLAEYFCDDEPFDASWMDADSWEETR